ncbi:MAG: hypothetical protein WD208_00490 [Dehalococcoidia bacterium]
MEHLAEIDPRVLQYGTEMLARGNGESDVGARGLVKQSAVKGAGISPEVFDSVQGQDVQETGGQLSALVSQKTRKDPRQLTTLGKIRLKWKAMLGSEPSEEESAKLGRTWNDMTGDPQISGPLPDDVFAELVARANAKADQ